MCHTGTSNGGKKWRMVLFQVDSNNKLLQIKRRFSRIDLFFEEGVCRWHMTDEKRYIPKRFLKDDAGYCLKVT